MSIQPLNFDNTLEIRTSLIGDSYAGKSVLFNKFSNNNLPDYTTSTLGIDFGNCKMEYKGLPIKFYFWDTAGHERFNSITKNYYRNMFRIFLVFDLSSSQGLKNVQKWINDIIYNCDENIKIILIGNKEDKPQKVNQEDIDFIINSNPVIDKYYSISAIKFQKSFLDHILNQITIDALTYLSPLDDYSEGYYRISTGLCLKKTPIENNNKNKYECCSIQ